MHRWMYDNMVATITSFKDSYEKLDKLLEEIKKLPLEEKDDPAWKTKLDHAEMMVLLYARNFYYAAPGLLMNLETMYQRSSANPIIDVTTNVIADEIRLMELPTDGVDLSPTREIARAKKRQQDGSHPVHRH